MPSIDHVQAVTCKRVSVTIPATGSTADTLASLASLTADEKGRCIGVKVCAKDTTGAARAAFVAGDSTASLPQSVASDTAYYEPAARDAVATYVKSAATAISNVCVVFYMLAVAE